MKIGIFTEVYEPYISGVATSVKVLKEALEKMNNTVYVVTANLERAKFKYDEAKRVIYLPGIKTGIYNTRLTNIYSKKAMKIIKEWNLDIIHSQTEFGVGAFSRVVSKKLNIPIVHTYHTLYEDYVYYVTHGHFDNIAKKIAIKITKYFCEKKCDEVIVPTEKIKNLFIDKYGITKNINVIPTGIDLSKFKLNSGMKKELTKLKTKYKIKEDDFVIGAIGRMAKEKSFDKLILNTKEMITLNNKIKLVLVGDGPDLDNLKELVKSLKMEKNIIFTGKVPYENVPIYYQLFDILASFSVTETQGLTIIEALASRKPTICINDESFIAMIQNNYNGFLFDNDEKFKNYVFKLINNKSLYKEMANNAYNSTYQYSKEVFASNVLKVYYKAMNCKK